MEFWKGFEKVSEDKKDKKLHPGYAASGAGLGAAYGYNHPTLKMKKVPGIIGIPKNSKELFKNLKTMARGSRSFGAKKLDVAKMALPGVYHIARQIAPAAIAGALGMHALRSTEDVKNAVSKKWESRKK